MCAHMCPVAPESTTHVFT